MIGGNYAGTTAQIGLGALRRAALPQNQSNLGTDLAQGFSQAVNSYRQQKAQQDYLNKQQAYADALKSGDQEAIKNAWIDLDAAGYADYANKQAETEAQRQFAREQQDRSLANQMRMFNMRQQADQQAEAERENQLKSALESGMITADEYNQAKRRDLLGEIAKTVEPDVTEEQSRKQAQDSINQLAGVAERNNIGIFTDWRRSHGLTGAETEREYGRISSAVAGLAPRAIAKLKESGVSGINSLPEFMTYIGLPQNPTSAQIAGAIPMMAQIAGVDNPLANQPTQAQKMKGLFGKSNGVQVGQQIGNFKVIGVE